MTHGRATFRPAVVFRCNASPQVGLGHLLRCRELARLLTGAGHICAMVGPPDSLRHTGDAALFARWHAVERDTAQQDAGAVLAMAAACGATHLVMDDYRIDPDYQLILKAAGMRWLQQFDASTPWDFHADVLVNAGPSEQRSDYLKYLKNPSTETLFGPSYAVLRPDFVGLVARPDSRAVTRILVSFGGGDDRGAIALAQTALGDLPGITLVIVSGPSNPRNAALAANPPGTAELHIDPADMPGLMAGCDLALIAGGTMSYEAASCGLPMVLIPLAANQARSCQGWASQVGAVVLDSPGQLTSRRLRQAVTALIGDTPRRRSMAAQGRALVDGKGGQRLLEALLGDAWVAPTLPEA